MSCCIPGTFNLLCALMADRGGIWGRFTSRLLENPAARLLYQQGVTSTDKGKPRSVPSPRQEGTQPPGAAVAEKVGGLQGEQFSPCTLSSASQPPSHTAPRPDGFVLQPPCSQPCSFVLPTHLQHHIPPSAQLPQLHRAGCRLSPSRKGCKRVGPLPPPWFHGRSSPTAMLHTHHLPAAVPWPSTSRPRTPLLEGPERSGEPSRNHCTAAMPRGTHPTSRMILKGIISKEMQDGDEKSLARGKSPPPWSALTRFPGQCPGTNTLSWHSPPRPCAATPAGAAVTPAAPPSFIATAWPRPSASREENGKNIACGCSQDGGAGGAGRCGGAHTRVHTHTAPHIRVHPHTQPHTHPLSLHRCRCTSSIFCAPAPTRQGGQCSPSPGTAPAATSPSRRGHRGQREGRHGVSGRAAPGSDPLPHRGPGRCGCPGTGMG